jgi:hypothetical protein
MSSARWRGSVAVDIGPSMARLEPARGGYHLPMDAFLRLEPTPEALHKGRRSVAAVGIIVAGVALFILLVPGATDPNWLGILASTSLALAGSAIAYLGQPTLLRFRIGLILMGIGIVASFYLLIAEPLKAVPA